MTTTFDDNLIRVGIIERDTTGDVQLVWAYPSFPADLSQRAIAHSGLLQHGASPSPVDGAPPSPPALLRFRYNNFANEWAHFWAGAVPEDAHPALVRGVSCFSLVLVTRQFNPEKYAAVSEALWRAYAAQASTPAVLQLFLGVFRANRAEHADGTVAFSDDEQRFDPRRALLVASAKDIARSLGEGSVTLWTALLLKRRVAVFSERLVALLRVIRGFPSFVWHRQDWSILRPHVDVASEAELGELRAAGVYCAGFTDPAIKANSALWDILVDIDAREVRVAEAQKGDFEQTAFQRGLSRFMVESAEDAEVAPQQFLRSVAEKTKELLGKLQSLRVEDPADGGMYVTLEGLQAVKLPPKMDSFLYAVAVAEGYTKQYEVQHANAPSASS